MRSPEQIQSVLGNNTQEVACCERDVTVSSFPCSTNTRNKVIKRRTRPEQLEHDVIEEAIQWPAEQHYDESRKGRPSK